MVDLIVVQLVPELLLRVNYQGPVSAIGVEREDVNEILTLIVAPGGLRWSECWIGGPVSRLP